MGARAFISILLAIGVISPAHAQSFAYVANQNSDNVSVIDTATNAVVATVPVGARPRGVAITPDGKTVYVANFSSTTVSLIDIATNTVTGTVIVGANPRGIAIAPSGAYAYVANNGSNSVSIVDTATNAVISTVAVGVAPEDVAFTPDGAYAFVANFLSGNASIIDTGTRTVTSTVAVGAFPGGVAVTPNGAFAYVTNLGSNNVSVIDTATRLVVATVPVGTVPADVAITPDGDYAYVTNQNSHNVSVIDTTSNTVAVTVAVGNSPRGIAITPNGAFAYVASQGSNSISVIDTATNTVAGAVNAGSFPTALAITPPGPPKYVLTELGTLGETHNLHSQGYAISQSGHVTGEAFTSANGGYHAYLWNGIAMRDLGTLGGTYSTGVAVNSIGQVTGNSTYDPDEPNRFHAFLWDGTTLQDLGTLGGVSSFGHAINDVGQVIGSSRTADGGQRAFLWNGTTMQDLGALGGTISEGRDINAAGKATGSARLVGNTSGHPFLWDGTTMHDLGSLGGTFGGGVAINNSGQVTGSSQLSGNVQTHAFLWDGVTMRDLGTLGGTDSQGYALNDSGQVTGYSRTTDPSVSRPFLWDGNTMHDLGSLGGNGGAGYAINSSGRVTGFSTVAGTHASHAFLWDGTALHDLNALIDLDDPLQPYVTLYEGRDINDVGQIAAHGCDSRTGECHAYLVTPFDLDEDADSVPYGMDNCPTISNADQADADDDGVGDACEVAADSTPPQIQANVVGTLGTAGWHVSDVQVEWVVTDAESTVLTSEGCDVSHVAGDTPGVTLTCTATSDGGTASESVTIKRDATAPSVIATASPMPNGNGWNNSDVTVTYSGSDATSGILSCYPPELLSSEGSNLSVHWGTCTDNAGNVSPTATPFAISIDKTPPIVTATAAPPPNGAGWNSTPVVVSFTGFDSLSGIELGYCDPPSLISSNGMGQTAVGRCVDRAGNAAFASYTGLNIDTTPPVAVASRAPPANANGWNNTNVTASWNGTDALSGSGVLSCSPPFIFAEEGANQEVSGTCLDVAGLVSPPAVIAGINIDKTGPGIPSIFSPVPNDGFVVGEAPAANYSCQDSLSGIATCNGSVANGAAVDTLSLGSKVFSVTAMDRANNFRSVNRSYFVNPVNTVLITTIAGNGASGFSGDGGVATSANLRIPFGLAVDAAGNLYIADVGNQRIRRVSSDGIISTVAGNGTAGFGGDGGAALNANINDARGVAADTAGNLYIADSGNNRIRRVSSNGIISTVAGNGTAGFGGDGGAATSANLSEPQGIALDADGSLYIADLVNHRIRRVSPDGIITTVAGRGTAGFSGDGGLATSANLNTPHLVAVDGAKNLYITDVGNQRIRRVGPDGIISTVAGNGIAGFSGDGGAATSARLNFAPSIAVDAAGNLYIADRGNNRIRRVTPSGVISTVAGTGAGGFSGDGGVATSANFGAPAGVAVDVDGDIYVSQLNIHRARRIRDTTFSLAPMATFGSQALNVSSAPQSVTLTNRGPQPVSVTSISITGANPSQFSQTNDCGIQTFQLVETTCTINVVFRPTSNGAKSAVLNVSTAAGSGSKSVAISGTGGATYVLDPYGHAFGSQPVGLVSITKSVTLTNTGTLALAVSSITINGTNGNQFSQTNDCVGTVAAGASCTIDAFFLPTSVGPKTAILNVNAGSGAGTKMVSLTGTGTPPTYALSPGELNFGNQAISVPSAAMIVTLTNTGSIPVPITSVTDTGTNANQYSETHNCGSSVPVGASCSISVTFLPTSGGAKVATLSVNAGGGAGTQTVPLFGTGVVPSYSLVPTSVAFGSQPRGTSSRPLDVTVVNTGSVQLSILTIARTGAMPGQFSQTNTCGSPVAVGGSCTISVTFSPTSAGSKSAILNVTASGGAGTKTVALTGTGT